VRHVDSSTLGFSLSSYQPSFIRLIFSSRFLDVSKHVPWIGHGCQEYGSCPKNQGMSSERMKFFSILIIFGWTPRVEELLWDLLIGTFLFHDFFFYEVSREGRERG
jgi:hypothetical protein